MAERRWHGLDDGVLAYALAVLRSLWVWPLLYLISRRLYPGQSELLAPLVVFGLLAGGTLAAQSGSFLIKGNRRAPLIVAVGGLVAVIVALYLGLGRERAPFWDLRWLGAAPAHPDRVLLILVPAVWLWWWGILAGRERVSYDGLARNFALGLSGLLAVMILSSATQIMPVSTMLAILLAFLALGLFVVALVSILDARRFEGIRSNHELPLARHWWGMIGAVVATLLVVAVLLSRLFLPETLDFLVTWASTILVFIAQITAWLILIVSYPVLMLLEWLLRLLLQRQGGAPPPQIMLPPSLADQFGSTAAGNSALAPGLYMILQGAGGALAVALIVLLFVRAFRRFRTYAEDDVAEAHESVLSLGLLKAQLAQMFRRRGAGGGQRAPFVALGGDEPGACVRRTYQALLAWAAAAGLARPPGMTPDRFEQLLGDAYPGHREQFRFITGTYDCARYGGTPVTEESADAVAGAWQQILERARQSEA